MDVGNLEFHIKSKEGIGMPVNKELARYKCVLHSFDTNEVKGWPPRRFGCPDIPRWYQKSAIHPPAYIAQQLYTVHYFLGEKAFVLQVGMSIYKWTFVFPAFFMSVCRRSSITSYHHLNILLLTQLLYSSISAIYLPLGGRLVLFGLTWSSAEGSLAILANKERVISISLVFK